MPQFVRHPKTGQIGYWDGQKIVPLAEGNIDEMMQGATGVRFENISPEDRKRVEAEIGPAGRAAELASGREAAVEASQDPTFLAEKQQEGRESLPELLKFAAGTAIPAVVSGGASGAASALFRNPGMVSRLARMAAGGAGGYGGEKLAQEVGVSEGGEGTAIASGALGALPGVFRSGSKPVTAEQRRISRLAAGESVAEESRTARGIADRLYAAARAGDDIDTDALLRPLDDAIMREMNTPNFDERIVERMMGLRDSMSQRIRQTTTPRATTTAVQEEAPINTIEGIMQRLRRRSPSAQQAVRQPTGRIAESSIQASPENLVDDIKQLQKMARDAERLGRSDLAVNIRRTYQQMAGQVPGMSEADQLYAQSKGLQRGAKATRSSGAVGVANILDDPKLSGGLTAGQKAFLAKQAAESDRIGSVVQAMIKNPLGRALLRRGITPEGTAVPAAWSAAMQIGARMAGLGQSDEPSAAPTAY